MAGRDTKAETKFARPTARTIVGILVAALIVLFIALNRDRTEISFVLFTADTALWIALTVAAAGGFAAGFLISRRRYR